MDSSQPNRTTQTNPVKLNKRTIRCFSSHSHVVNAVMVPTIAVRASAAPIAYGVGRVRIVTIHKIAVRATEVRQSTFNAKLKLCIASTRNVLGWTAPEF
jgi:hypothetical protein